VLDARAIDRRSVGRLQVVKDPQAVAVDQAGVMARNRGVRQHDVAAKVAANRQLRLAALPIERQERRRVRHRLCPAAETRPEPGQTGYAASEPAGRPAHSQITQERERLDEAPY